MIPNVNLGKLVPLEVHGRVENVKIAILSLVGMGRALYRWKAKKKSLPTS